MFDIFLKKSSSERVSTCEMVGRWKVGVFNVTRHETLLKSFIGLIVFTSFYLNFPSCIHGLALLQDKTRRDTLLLRLLSSPVPPLIFEGRTL